MSILINGPIVDDTTGRWLSEYGYVCAYPEMVRNALAEEGDSVNVYINSPGGNVADGSEIYTLLRESGKNIGVFITGMAASAASVIAMAGGVIRISPTAYMMIHNAWGYGATGETLDTINKGIANAYAVKTGLKQDEILKMMNHETWMSAGEAREKGFVDEFMFDDDEKAVASLSGGRFFDAKNGGGFMPKVGEALSGLKNAEEAVDPAKIDAIIDGQTTTNDLLAKILDRMPEKATDEESKQENSDDAEDSQSEEISDAQKAAIKAVVTEVFESMMQ